MNSFKIQITQRKNNTNDCVLYENVIFSLMRSYKLRIQNFAFPGPGLLYERIEIVEANLGKKKSNSHKYEGRCQVVV